jgi:hypothetical protein
MKIQQMRTLLIAFSAIVLSACVYVPRTTEVYDVNCKIVTKEMTLQPMQIARLEQSRGTDGAGFLVLAGATAVASAVVSGSIVVVGNVVYWFEKQGRCVRE